MTSALGTRNHTRSQKGAYAPATPFCSLLPYRSPSGYSRLFMPSFSSILAYRVVCTEPASKAVVIGHGAVLEACSLMSDPSWWGYANSGIGAPAANSRPQGLTTVRSRPKVGSRSGARCFAGDLRGGQSHQPDPSSPAGTAHVRSIHSVCTATVGRASDSPGLSHRRTSTPKALLRVAFLNGIRQSPASIRNYVHGENALLLRRPRSRARRSAGCGRPSRH